MCPWNVLHGNPSRVVPVLQVSEIQNCRTLKTLGSLINRQAYLHQGLHIKTDGISEFGSISTHVWKNLGILGCGQINNCRIVSRERHQVCPPAFGTDDASTLYESCLGFNTFHLGSMNVWHGPGVCILYCFIALYRLSQSTWTQVHPSTCFL